MSMPLHPASFPAVSAPCALAFVALTTAPAQDMTASGKGDMLDRSHPAGRTGTPEDIAGPALLLAGRGGAHLSGIILTTDGGMTNIRLDALPSDVARLHLPTARRLRSEVGTKARL